MFDSALTRSTAVGILMACPYDDRAQTVYFVLHCRLRKMALVAVVLSTVYIIRELPSGRYSEL